MGSNLRVMSSNPQVTCSNLRVMSSNTRVTSSHLWAIGSNPQVLSLKTRVKRLKTQIGILKVGENR